MDITPSLSRGRDLEWGSDKKRKSDQQRCCRTFSKKLGYVESLIKATEALEVFSETTFVDPSWVAILYLMAGNNKKALDCLEKAYEIRSQSLPYLRMPYFDPIREEPRFQVIARKMGLPHK